MLLSWHAFGLDANQYRAESWGDGLGFGQGGSVADTYDGGLQPDAAADVGRIAYGVGMVVVIAVKKGSKWALHTPSSVVIWRESCALGARGVVIMASQRTVCAQLVRISTAS